MPYPWLDAYLLEKPGTIKEFHQAFNAYRYLVGDKLFAMQGGDKYEAPIFTLKLEPEHGILLRREYPEQIVPGYYMNKTHWNSLYTEGSVPEDVVRHMADESYRIVFASLPKRKQKELFQV